MRRSFRRPRLSIRQILEWADAHFERTGRWPRAKDGRVIESVADKWAGIDDALSGGYRGLPGGSSLPRLLAERRGRRNRGALPRLTIRRILQWADAYRLANGRWPSRSSGAISEAPGETWYAVHKALLDGCRGLPGGTTLAKLLAARRGVRNPKALEDLTLAKILKWADAHFRRTGAWPKQTSGPVVDAPGETWSAIDATLNRKGRGWNRRTSLSRLLRKHRGMRRPTPRPRWKIDDVLDWADTHRASTGRWPSAESGTIAGTDGRTWRAVDHALREGYYGLKGGSSLALLLAARRGKRDTTRLPPLRIRDILAWADDFHSRHGRWPTNKSGAIDMAPAERWSGVDKCLLFGRRGLPGGSSLAQLLASRRGKRNRAKLPPLRVDDILAWADDFHRRHGRWPSNDSGAIHAAAGENWNVVSGCLRSGFRGLPGGSTLAQLLALHRGKRNPAQLPPLRIDEILAWADDFYRRHGHWPHNASGAIGAAPGETWSFVDKCLRNGLRGLPGGSSLSQLMAPYRQRKVD